MCWPFRRSNILVEILFPKNFWAKQGVEVFMRELFMTEKNLYCNIYSEYYIYIYEDKRLFTNLRTVSDPRRHII
jgi:hypothetical protein